MAYTPINWQTGDTITADKLNRCDNGWRVESTQLFSETVTTEAGEYGNEGMLTYSSQVSSPTITVTFDGTNYQCSVVKMGEGYGYGGVSSGWEYDFTTYPFAFVFSNGDSSMLSMQSPIRARYRCNALLPRPPTRRCARQGTRGVSCTPTCQAKTAYSSTQFPMTHLAMSGTTRSQQG